MGKHAELLREGTDRVYAMGVVPMRESEKWTGHLKSGSDNRALKNSKVSAAEGVTTQVLFDA